MDIAFPGESAEYRAARDRLLDQEIELSPTTSAFVGVGCGCQLGTN